MPHRARAVHNCVQACQTGSWGACSGAGPIAEICNGEDDDCDGEADDGLRLGEACVTAGGCSGVFACGDDQRACECVARGRGAPEVCDDVDNDCHRLVDLVVDRGSLRWVCICEARTLSITRAMDASIETGLNLCATTQCPIDLAPMQRKLDGRCYPVCQGDSDPDRDGVGKTVLRAWWQARLRRNAPRRATMRGQRVRRR